LKATARSVGSCAISAAEVDRSVEAARPARLGDHIPQRDAAVTQRGNAPAVGQFAAGADQIAHQVPEQVARVRVVLARGERRPAGKAAQDQQPRCGAEDRREGAGVVSRDGQPRRPCCA